jgi:hypothetical protein
MPTWNRTRSLLTTGCQELSGQLGRNLVLPNSKRLWVRVIGYESSGMMQTTKYYTVRSAEGESRPGMAEAARDVRLLETTRWPDRDTRKWAGYLKQLVFLVLALLLTFVPHQHSVDATPPFK